MTNNVTVTHNVLAGEINETLTIVYEFNGHPDYTILEYMPIMAANCRGDAE